MSYCYYVSNIVVVPEKPPEDKSTLFDFNPRSINIHSNVEDFFPLRRGEILFSSDSCRETLVDFLHEFQGEAEFHGRKRCIFGVRAFSSIYHRLATFIYGNEQKSISLENFIHKVTGISCTITAGFIPKDRSHEFSAPTEFSLTDGTKIPNNGYVEIIFHSRHSFNEEFPLKLTAILGMLRERRIYRKIISGQISTRLQLAKEFVKMGFSRFKGNPTGMISLEYTGHTRTSLRDFVESCESFVNDADNGEGSGYIDTIITGFFWIIETFPQYVSMYSGPIDLADSNIPGPEILKKLVPKKYKSQILYMCDEYNLNYDFILIEHLRSIYDEE